MNNNSRKCCKIHHYCETIDDFLREIDKVLYFATSMLHFATTVYLGASKLNFLAELVAKPLSLEMARGANTKRGREQFCEIASIAAEK
jgi:hypothetical protein